MVDLTRGGERGYIQKPLYITYAKHDWIACFGCCGFDRSLCEEYEAGS